MPSGSAAKVTVLPGVRTGRRQRYGRLWGTLRAIDGLHAWVMFVRSVCADESEPTAEKLELSGARRLASGEGEEPAPWFKKLLDSSKAHLAGEKRGKERTKGGAPGPEPPASAVQTSGDDPREVICRVCMVSSLRRRSQGRGLEEHATRRW